MKDIAYPQLVLTSWQVISYIVRWLTLIRKEGITFFRKANRLETPPQRLFTWFASVY